MGNANVKVCMFTFPGSIFHFLPVFMFFLNLAEKNRSLIPYIIYLLYTWKAGLKQTSEFTLSICLSKADQFKFNHSQYMLTVVKT